MTDVIGRDLDQEAQSPEFIAELARITETYKIFIDTAVSTEATTWLANVFHPNSSYITESPVVRRFLVDHDLVASELPEYYTIEFDETWADETHKAHIRVIAQGITPTGVEFTLGSSIVFDAGNRNASEALFLIPGPIDSQSAKRLDAYREGRTQSTLSAS